MLFETIGGQLIKIKDKYPDSLAYVFNFIQLKSF